MVSTFLASRLWSCYISRGVWWYDFIIVLWVWESGRYVWLVAFGAADRGWKLSLLWFLFKNSKIVCVLPDVAPIILLVFIYVS